MCHVIQQSASHKWYNSSMLLSLPNISIISQIFLALTMAGRVFRAILDIHKTTGKQSDKIFCRSCITNNPVQVLVIKTAKGMQIPFQALLVVRNPKVATQWSPLVL